LEEEKGGRGEEWEERDGSENPKPALRRTPKLAALFPNSPGGQE